MKYLVTMERKQPLLVYTGGKLHSYIEVKNGHEVELSQEEYLNIVRENKPLTLTQVIPTKEVKGVK